MTTVRVAVVDDHPVARWGVESLLHNHPEFEIITSTDSAAGLADQAVDIVILDLYLNGPGPALRTVTELSGRYRVLVMSASARRADVLAAVRAGADGFLNKRAKADDFVAAVRLVAAGGFYLSSELADMLQADLGETPPPVIRLSPREEQVLHYIAAGLTHGQAATRLGIRAATVDTYVKRIRAKIGLGNKADLTRIAIELGQLDGDPSM
jgi:DNA-binding NarL/FixJ family response regulator